MPDYLDHLKAAISALEQELEKDQRYVALRDLRQVYASASRTDSVGGNADSRFSAVAEPRRTPPKRELAPTTKQAIDEAERLLAGRISPVPLQQIYNHLVTRGCRIGGQKPVNSLSAILSRSGKFEAHGRSGWTLITDIPGDDTASEDDEGQSANPRYLERLLEPMPNGQIHEGLSVT